MRRTSLLNVTVAVLLCAVTTPARPQDLREQERTRREKLETILRTQDLRTPHDGTLVSYLSDPDPVVRERATFAFGSIQDTVLVGVLTRNLTDPSVAIQNAAAFALGQTGTVLSLKGRQELEYDLLWKRIEQTAAAPRLLEEIGKFGTETGLRDVMIRIGNLFPVRHDPALTMCIARFAVRGIVVDDGVRYILRFIKPAELTPWEISYALLRVGDHPLVRQELDYLVLLWRHPDPSVRMNLALLLGKLKDPATSLEPLMTLARFDRDWRVRVNAFKALAEVGAPPRDDILETFKIAFFDQDQLVAAAALGAFGSLTLNVHDSSRTLQETLRQLKYVAENTSGDFHWQVQAEAVSSLARLLGEPAFPVLRGIASSHPRLMAQIIRAWGSTGASDAYPLLEQYAKKGDPLVRTAALDGIRTLLERHPRDSAMSAAGRDILMEALESEDAAVMATAASYLGDSLLLSPVSLRPLLTALSHLRVPDDLDAMREIISTVGKLKDTRAVPILREEVDQPDRTIAVAAAQALTDITGQDHSRLVPPYIQPLYVDFDFGYLNSLPDTIRVLLETVRGDVTLELYKRDAPFTVMSFLKLATRRGFYRGLVFHRVVPNFVVQGGDPRGDGWGGPGYTIRSEFSPTRYETGVVGMASAGKDTEGCQFFITHSPQPHLDGRYTVFGRVVSGQEAVNRILLDDRIFEIRLLGD